MGVLLIQRGSSNNSPSPHWLRCVMKMSFSTFIGTSLSFLAIAGLSEVTAYSGDTDRGARCCAPVLTQTIPHRGYLSSPRGREEFPWLARTPPEVPSQAYERPPVKQNQALANSPRFREEHPELLRPTRRLEGPALPAVPPEVLKNTALAASPRAREEFPGLRFLLGPSTEKQIACLCGSHCR